MATQRAFTLDEIERETGFDKRTVAYYVQEDLLPKVGRRGPRTRYPQSYLDRLLFIRKVRELQDQGQLGSVTLGDIKEFFDGVPERRIADVVAGRRSLESVFPGGVAHGGKANMASPRHRADALRRSERFLSESSEQDAARSSLPPTFDASRLPPSDENPSTVLLDLDSGPPVLELREIAEPTLPYAVAHQPRRADLDTISGLLSSLAEAAGSRAGSRRGSSEHWTRARIAPGLSISARNLEESDAPLLERLALELRRLISKVE